ncbi:MAG: AEC family transporter [Pseudomonadota bacterium]|nr:AEC family transporter [Pseudomonadota bacterium]
MSAVADIVLPVFILIGIGYALGRSPLLGGDAGIRALTNFVFYAAIPALLFRLFARGLPEGVTDWSIVFAYYTAAFSHFALTMAIGRTVFGHRGATLGLMGMSAGFSNTVLLGLPLVLTGFGEPGMVPLMMIVSFHPMLLITLPTIVVEVMRGEPGQGIGRIALSTVNSLLRHPVILGLLAGLLFAQTGLQLPAILDRVIDLLSQAATPAALCALGASLTQFRIAGDLKESLTLVVLKLVALPAMVWVLATFVFRADPLAAHVGTVIAAMPAGVNAFLLARYYGTYTQRSASAILIGTACSLVTVSVLIALFRTA